LEIFLYVILTVLLLALVGLFSELQKLFKSKTEYYKTKVIYYKLLSDNIDYNNDFLISQKKTNNYQAN